MASADLELQGAIVASLRNYAPLTALVGGKVYDMPPPDAVEPYVVMGNFDVHRADVTCKHGYRIYATLHAWSAYSGGFAEVKQIAEAVTDALHDQPLALTTNRLVSLEHRQTMTMRDPDGVSSHSVMEFVAFIERT